MFNSVGRLPHPLGGGKHQEGRCSVLEGSPSPKPFSEAAGHESIVGWLTTDHNLERLERLG